MTFEARPQEDRMIRKEGRKTFQERVDGFREQVKKDVAVKHITILLEGFVAHAGGHGKLTEEDCDKFIKQFSKSFRDVPERADPAYVMALAREMTWNEGGK